MIDPGHGGKDPGALGPSGYKEATVTLAVGLELRRLLKLNGVNALMTRETDKYLNLSQRAQIANKSKAVLFLSIHCNSATSPASGIETFCARQTKVGYPFAENVQESLMAAFPDHADRGVKRANFTVLKRTKMPAVLAELEFIHTPDGERHLSNKVIQRRYAQALMRGVLIQLGMKPAPVVKDPPEPKPCRAVQLGDVVREKANELIDAAGRYGS